jgi:glutaredoxin
MEGCAACNSAVNLLKAKGIEHKVVKIDEGMDAARFIRAQGFRSMPQIYKDDVLIPGGFKGLESHLNNAS